MSLFRKKREEKQKGLITKRGKRGHTRPIHTAKRYIFKLVASFFLILVFGVIYSGGNAQAIFDLAWQGDISWFKALRESLLKAVQWGTINFDEIVSSGFQTMMEGRVPTAVINYLLPLTFLYMGYFYATSIFVDLLDGREGEVVRYWVIAVFTVFVMVFTWAVMNGFIPVFDGADVTFNNTEIKQNLRTHGYADPLPDAGHTQSNETVNASVETGSDGLFDFDWSMFIRGE